MSSNANPTDEHREQAREPERIWIDMRPGALERQGCQWLVTEQPRVFFTEYARVPTVTKYRVQTPSGVFVEGIWDSRADVPAKLPDRWEHYFETEEYIVEVQVAAPAFSSRDAEVREILSGFIHAGVEFDDERMNYVVMQIDRRDLEKARELYAKLQPKQDAATLQSVLASDLDKQHITTDQD